MKRTKIEQSREWTLNKEKMPSFLDVIQFRKDQ